jgi:hypothetical protein
MLKNLLTWSPGFLIPLRQPCYHLACDTITNINVEVCLMLLTQPLSLCIFSPARSLLSRYLTPFSSTTQVLEQMANAASQVLQDFATTDLYVFAFLRSVSWLLSI